MGIAKKALKTAAWVKAPKLMFAKRNPKKAALLAATSWVTSRVLPQRRKKTSFRRTAVQGLGAAALAIPVGLWVGRKARGGGE
jgi:prophage antirepressor-like protein